MKTTITASLCLTPLQRIEHPRVIVEDGVILAVGSRAALEVPAGSSVRRFPGAVLVPGFIDVHIHGAAGHDIMEGEAEGLAAVEHLLAAHGVTSYFPTTLTAPLDTTLRALEKLADAVEGRQRDGCRACPLGIHLEGPFLSHARRGVHPASQIQQPSVELFERMWQTARGRLSLMTIAPELPGAEEVIALAAARGMCVCLGHSDADAAQTRAGIAAGARHATHTFNGMRPLDHRHPGILGVVLGDDRLTADIIADGVHIDPLVIDLFLKAKGADGAVLISDAISATGMPDGRYRLGTFEVQVAGARATADGKLAGSVLTLDQAVRNVMDFAGWELQQAVRLATLNPARVVGKADRKGSLAPGSDADIVVLSPRGEVIETSCQW